MIDKRNISKTRNEGLLSEDTTGETAYIRMLECRCVRCVLRCSSGRRGALRRCIWYANRQSASTSCKFVEGLSSSQFLINQLKYVHSLCTFTSIPRKHSIDCNIWKAMKYPNGDCFVCWRKKIEQEYKTIYDFILLRLLFYHRVQRNL